MSHAITTEGLCWSPDKSFALRELDLRVPRGSIYGFLGPNGAGKTTVIRILLGMIRPRAGRVRVLEGRVPEDLPHILARVGYVPERPHVYPQLTVEEAMNYHASFHRLWDPHWVDTLIDRLGIDPTRKIARMSKGETGKLLVSLALGQRPELLILDEPTDGLDPVIRRDVMTTVLEYVSETGATVFISSHLVHELERICDWVGVLDAGRLVAELPMNDFKNGIKRLRVEGAPARLPAEAPFALLDRISPNGVPYETWVVRGWADGHTDFLARAGATVRDVIDLDLEDGFVELLRSQRTPARETRDQEEE
jgi:ABC-2 type transport system ATP-binding protein